MAVKLSIPETIVVHLGPPDSNAKNVTVRFPDYIKNVASSEIYPTWPENAIRANIIAQISFALNRLYSEYYRTRGYDFDITSSPAYDQAFVPQRDIFENISQIVDEIFNDYAVREGDIFPLFTQYCDGRNVQCDGLSQWGTVTLANRGLSPLEILQNYYGNDIALIENAPVQNIPDSYPGMPLKLRDSGVFVRIMQMNLNRISKNYPGIRKIPDDSIGFFGVSTENAVKDFQKAFNLTQDGIVGKATWYKIMYVYFAVKKIAELDAEKIQLENVIQAYKSTLQSGDVGNDVRAIQYFLKVVAAFNNEIRDISIDGIFGEQTRLSVESFQSSYNLPVTGIVDENTWNKLNEVYKSYVSKIPENTESSTLRPYPGTALSIGSENANVQLMQQYLNQIAMVYKSIPTVDETGYYGMKTAQTVSAFQEEFDLPVSGVIGPVTWYKITQIISDM